MRASERLDAAIDDVRPLAKKGRPPYPADRYWEALRVLLAAVEEYRIEARPLFEERARRPSPYE